MSDFLRPCSSSKPCCCCWHCRRQSPSHSILCTRIRTGSWLIAVQRSLKLESKPRRLTAQAAVVCVLGLTARPASACMRAQHSQCCGPCSRLGRAWSGFTACNTSRPHLNSTLQRQVCANLRCLASAASFSASHGRCGACGLSCGKPRPPPPLAPFFSTTAAYWQA